MPAQRRTTSRDGPSRRATRRDIRWQPRSAARRPGSRGWLRATIGECQPMVEHAGVGSMNEAPAADPKPIAHGGRLNEARRMFPGAPEPFLDLSTGINPVPYPLPNFVPDCFTRLPEPEAETALLSAAAAAYGAIDPSLLAAAPGTQILIDLLPRLWPAETVAVLGPTYAEHAHAWSKIGANVATVADIAALEDASVAVVCNPNNPDGRRIA